MFNRTLAFLAPLALAGGLFAFHPSAEGQGNPTCPTRPVGDSSNACASTAFVQNVSGSFLSPTGVTPGTYGNAANVGQFIVGADGRLTSAVNVAITGGGGTSALSHTHLFVGNVSNIAADFGSAMNISDSGMVTISPTVFSSVPGYVVTQTSPLNGSRGQSTAFGYNTITLTDLVGVTASGSTDGFPNSHSIGLYVLDVIGGPNLAGAHKAIQGVLRETVANSASGDTAAVGGQSYSNVSGPSGAQNQGNLVGGAFQSFCDTGCNKLLSEGVEIDVALIGAVSYRAGLGIWSIGTGQGSLVDAAIAVTGFNGGFGTTGQFGSLITLTNYGGQNPLTTTANLFTADTAYTVANVFNLSNMTVTGNILNFPNVVLTGAGALSLGTPGSAVGSVSLANATSGTVKLQPVTGALGTVTASLPANTGTIAETNLAQTWSAAQTFNANDLVLGGVTGSTQCLQANSSGVVTGTGSGCGGGGTPGGSNTQVQYNNSSAFGGISGVTSNGTVMTFATSDLIINGGSATTGLASVTSGGVVSSCAACSLATSLTVPIVYGGSVAGSTLNLQSTSSGSPSGDSITLTTGGSVRTSVLSNGNIGFGTETNPQVPFVFSTNAVTGANPGTIITTFGGPWAVGAVSATTVGWNTLGVAGPTLNNFVRIDGTITSPSNLGFGDVIGSITFGGWGNGTGQLTRARIFAAVTEPSGWATTFGTSIEIDTTAAGGSRAQAMLLKGGVIIGTGTTDPGAGQLAVTAMTQTSAAQNGTVCYSTTIGALTYDATLGCLTSLEELKDIHGPITGALAEVSAMKPFWFSPINRPAGSDLAEQPGFGAHQIESVDRRLVGYGEDGKLRGVRYMEMTAVLAAAIQELKADNDNLRIEVETLKRNSK
jgi:hypothetical protein